MINHQAKKPHSAPESAPKSAPESAPDLQEARPAFQKRWGARRPDSPIALAAEFLESSKNKGPVDQALRAALKPIQESSPADAKEITRLVFNYYRWWGWLNPGSAPLRQLAEAAELNGKFRSNPKAFSDLQLMERSVPSWVKGEVEITPEWVRSLQTESSLWIRIRRSALKTFLKDPDFADGLQRPFLPKFPEIGKYKGTVNLFETEAFQAGAFEIQDVSSQWVGQICQPKPGETWWDVCAGEGGKTLHLSELMENRGMIWATDRSKRRVGVLSRRAARSKCFNYRSVIWDASVEAPLKTRFDGILVDAPCSGLGTWGRNPHARWTTQPKDVAELAIIQLNLLNRVASSLKPGGRLIYSVCTLTRSETTQIVEQFTKTHPELHPFPLRPLLSETSASGESNSNSFWIWPQESGGNGMFVAAWQLPINPSAGKELTPETENSKKEPGILGLQ